MSDASSSTVLVSHHRYSIAHSLGSLFFCQQAVLYTKYTCSIIFLNRAFWYLNTHHPGQTHTHTQTNTHIYIYIYIMMDFWTLIVRFPGFLGGLCFLNGPSIIWTLTTQGSSGGIPPSGLASASFVWWWHTRAGYLKLSPVGIKHTEQSSCYCFSNLNMKCGNHWLFMFWVS